jgi:GAF domain-containing protein
MMESGRPEPWPIVLDEVTGALESLTIALESEDDFTVVLQRVCEQVVHAVPGVDEATVTLLTDDGPRTAATTSDLVAELDRDQYAADDGPCLEAARTGQIVRVAVSEAAQRWPVFARDSAAAGFGSFLSAPLVVNDEHAGAINCYSGSGGGFGELDEKLLDLYTGAITAVLRVYRRYELASVTAEQLRIALDSRAVIDQAKGILMALHQISANEAFTLLVEQSQRENIKLRELATRLVTNASAAQH